MALTTAQTGLSRARRGVAPGGPGKPANRKSKLSSQTRKTFFWLLLPSVEIGRAHV